MLAIVSPGQGAQSPQMYSPWLKDPRTSEILTSFSNFVGYDLIQLGTTAAADEIKQTQISQPLIVAASLMAVQLLELDRMEFEPEALIVAGHSVGEFVAAQLSGSIEVSDTLRLVAARGNAMAQAATLNSQTGMSAVLGGEKEVVISHLKKFDLIPANVNADGQIVAAGLISNLSALAENPLAGTRVRPLDVSAAFHTDFMTSAISDLKPFFDSIDFNDPQINIISNKDGERVLRGSDLRKLLLNQINSPVRWDLCQKNLLKHQVTGLLELAPGGVLAGIAKREMPGVELFAIKDLSDIPLAKDFIKSHAKVKANG